MRSAYSELVTAYLTDGGAQSATVEAKQTQDGWQSSTRSDKKMYIGTNIETSGVSGGAASGSTGEIEVECASKGGSYTVEINDDGDVSISAE